MGPFTHLVEARILSVSPSEALISEDRGKSWEAHPIFAQSDAFEMPARAVARTPDGVVVAAFYNLKERHWTWNDELQDAPGARLPTYVVRSLDDGKTWEKPVKLHDEWTGSVRDMIITRDGKIVFTTMMMRHNPGRHTVLTYMSDDRGQTWNRSNITDLGGVGHHGGVTEATLEDLRDGTLMKLIRTNWMQFWRAESRDSGRTWHPIGPSGIPASSAPANLRRLASGRLLLVWNQPYPEGQTSYPMRGGDGIWSAVPVSNHRSELSIFEQIANQTELPLLVYEHSNMPTSLIKRLATVPQVAGVKSHATLYAFYDQVRETRDTHFAVLGAGPMKQYLFGGQIASPGYPCPIAPVAPRISRRFYNAMKDGDMATAREMVFEYEEPLFKVTIPLGHP